MRGGSETEPSPAPDAQFRTAELLLWLEQTLRVSATFSFLASSSEPFYSLAPKCKRARDQVFLETTTSLHIASSLSGPLPLRNWTPVLWPEKAASFHQSAFGHEASLCGHFQSHWSGLTLGWAVTATKVSGNCPSPSFPWVPASQKAQSNKCHWGISGEETQTCLYHQFC